MMKPKPKTTENKEKLEKQKAIGDTKDLKKKKLVEKVVQAVKSKFKNLITDRNFDLSYMRKYIEEIFPTNLDDFNYNVFLIKAEKLILEKLSKIEVKKPNNGVPDLTQVKALIDIKTEKVLEKVERNETNNLPNVKKDSKIFSLATIEKEKKNDQWAVQAKEDHKIFLNEQKQNKKKVNEQKKMMKDMLDLQVKEKKQMEKGDKLESSTALQVKNRSKSVEKGIIQTKPERRDMDPIYLKAKNKEKEKLIDEKFNKEFLELEAK